MERSGIFRVSFLEVQASRLEVSQAVSLVSLSSNMKHIDSLGVSHKDVRTHLNEQLDQLHISMEGSEVQGVESFLTPARVIDPVI